MPELRLPLAVCHWMHCDAKSFGTVGSELLNLSAGERKDKDFSIVIVPTPHTLPPPNCQAPTSI